MHLYKRIVRIWLLNTAIGNKYFYVQSLFQVGTVWQWLDHISHFWVHIFQWYVQAGLVHSFPIVEYALQYGEGLTRDDIWSVFNLHLGTSPLPLYCTLP